MTMLQESAQYGDWEGTLVAEDGGGADIRDYLQKNKLTRQDEFPVGIKLSIGENHGGKVQPPSIVVLLFNKADFVSAAAALKAMPDPIRLREVRVNLTLEEFVGLFKRFSIALSPRGGLSVRFREYVAS